MIFVFRSRTTWLLFNKKQIIKRSMTMHNKSYGVAKNGATMRIDLTEKEMKICNVLRGVSDFIAKERPDLPLIECRIAGGWVRDKLLGKESHDLDIAINDMMGYEFATFVNKYLENQGVSTRSIAKIDSNPEKSKHLETATTKLFDQDIDFCNLRTEIYEEGSRIPSKITFGTPTEDAHRRDITINSLFYNINTSLVEDFTRKGIPDLINGLIRTPLAPYETFRDDPLRVLRCIRFASRFNFTIVSELCAAAKNEEIRDELTHKISRERIGLEFEKMITGPYPLLSLVLIHDLDLYSVIMAPPANIKSGTVGDGSLAVNAVSVVQWLCFKEDLQYESLKAISNSEKRTLILSASALPYLDVVSEIKKKEVPTVQLVCKDSIKTNNNDSVTVSTIYRGISLLKELADKNIKKRVKRSELGMVIRDLGSLWQTSLKLTAAKEILDTFPQLTWTQPNTIASQTGKEICEKYDKLAQLAQEYEIVECHAWKNIVDGKRAAQIVGVKPGPIITELLKVQMTWQLENPQGTKEECEEAIITYWKNK